MRLHKRFLSTSVLGLALAVAPAFGATAPASPSGTTAALSRIRIDNFGRISDVYYRGAQPSGTDYRDLAALGVRTVIDLQEDGFANEAGLVKAAGMKFYRIPMTTRVAPTADQLAQFLQIVNDATKQPVYVHCAGGRHRTGVMTAVYRMTHDAWTAEQAFNEMKTYKFGADFLHPEFKRFVYGFKSDAVAAVTAQPQSH